MGTHVIDSSCQSVTVLLNDRIVERVRDACYWSQRRLVHVVEDAIARALDAMEQENGGQFPARPSRKLKTGVTPAALGRRGLDAPQVRPDIR